MKLLILTQYFPPEVGAPQNRLFELAVRLQKKDIEVNVLTAMPNYPEMQIHSAYKGKFYCAEYMEGLKIFRSWIFVSKSKSLLLRLLNYFSFVFTSLFVGIFCAGKTDYILCESPPLFLGITAWLLKKIKGAKLIFNVSDLWPESAEKLGLVTNRSALGLATKLEEFLYRNSEIITGQTQGIVENISKRFPQKPVHWIPNGVDPGYYMPMPMNQKWRIEMGFAEKDLVFLYAGIVGHAQGLEVILHSAQMLISRNHIRFVILGSGPEKEKLEAMKESLQLQNVYFLDPVTKKEMPGIIAGIDIALIPLRKLDLFLGAIPSKIFENLAMEKPVLLGVEGEAKKLFIEDGKAGLAFEPENFNDLKHKVVWFDENRDQIHGMGIVGRKYVLDNFTRDAIAQKLANIIH